MKKEIFLKTPSDLEEEQEKKFLRESTEDFLRAFDQRIEEFIINSRPVNEGEAGLIFHLKKEDVPEHLFRELEAYGIEFKKEGSAMKVLKIFSSGKGEAEYNRQRDVHAALADARKKTDRPLASVPKPLLFRSIELSEEARRALNEKNAHLLGGQAEVILMDFVEGEDVLEKLFRLTLVHSGAHAEENDFKKNDFIGLWRDVAHFFGIRTPAGLLGHEASRELETAKKRCYDFLHKKGVIVQPRIVEQIENAVDALHGARIHHNDLHERNIMLTGEFDNPTTRVFFVDFANANTKDFTDVARLAQEGTRRISDSTVAHRLRKLTKSIQEEEQEIRKSERIASEHLLRRLLKDDAFSSNYEEMKIEIRKRTGDDALAPLLERRWRSAGLEKQIDWFFATLHGFLEEKIVEPHELDHALGVLSGYPYVTPYKRKRLRQFQEQFLKHTGGEL